MKKRHLSVVCCMLSLCSLAAMSEEAQPLPKDANECCYVIETYGIVNYFRLPRMAACVDFPGAMLRSSLGCADVSPSGKRLFVGRELQKGMTRSPVETAVIESSPAGIGFKIEEERLQFPSHANEYWGHTPSSVVVISEDACFVRDDSYEYDKMVQM